MEHVHEKQYIYAQLSVHFFRKAEGDRTMGFPKKCLQTGFDWLCDKLCEKLNFTYVHSL